MNSEIQLIKARTLKGFRDLLPADAIQKERMLETLREVFQSFGFVPIETPHIEYSEVLLGQSGEEIKKQLFQFEDQGGRDCTLRFDLTVPFARFVVQNQRELGMPFKRYAIGEVFRGERPQLGRYREFTQCDFDIVGTRSVLADLEIIQVIVECIRRLDLGEFLVRINNRRIMNGLSESIGVPEKTPEILRQIDKIDKIGEAGVSEALASETGLDKSQIDHVLSFIALSREGDNREILSRLKAFPTQSSEWKKGVQDLSEVLEASSKLENFSAHIKIDLSIARGLGYYTGIVYETVLASCPELGSVCSGGRYDSLTQTFSKDELPGVGASVGLDRILAALELRGGKARASTSAAVLVTQTDEQYSSEAVALAARLRKLGLASELFPECSKLKKQFKYADRRGHRFIVILGSEELAKGVIALKDLREGKQQDFSTTEELVRYVIQALNAQNKVEK